MFKKMKLLVLVMCAVMMSMAMTVSAFAEMEEPYYLVSNAAKTNNSIKVKVVVESKQYSETDDTVITGEYTINLNSSTDIPANQGSLGTQNSYYTVLDAMYKFSQDSSNGITAYDVHGNAIDLSDTYIFSMGLAGSPEKIFEPALPFYDPDYAIDGWMFRVNDRFPLLTNASVYTRTGAAINDTPIVDGDVIHFYWDYPYNETSTTYYSANYITADASYINGAANIQLVKSKNWHDNTGWNIDSFSNFTGGTGNYDAAVYDHNGTQLATGTVSKATGSGSIAFTKNGNSPYYVKVFTTAYKDVDGYDEYWDDITWHILDNTMAYAKIK